MAANQIKLHFSGRLVPATWRVVRSRPVCRALTSGVSCIRSGRVARSAQAHRINTGPAVLSCPAGGWRQAEVEEHGK